MNQLRDGQGKHSRPGKHVGGACYIHVAALATLSPESQARVEAAHQVAGLQAGDCNVVKLVNGTSRISLLSYPDFFTDPFPALAAAWTVNLTTGRASHTSYAGSANPPILHRKELLLPLDHPERQRFAKLTEALESRGLLRNANRIGHRAAWQTRLAAARVNVQDHAIVEQFVEVPQRVPAHSSPDCGGPNPGVARHLTAISRAKLSAPLQALARHGLLDEERSLLDYGCGRGDDLAILQAAGIHANGWDPHYRPDGALAPADMVNLGFVINVIEEPGERTATLRRAFDLTRECLVVAAMIVGKADVSGLTRYRDGFLTRRRTFQKYFTQEELRALIEGALAIEAIAVGPGIFFVFRDKIVEQRFLEGRRRRKQSIAHLLALTPPEKDDVRPSASQHRATTPQDGSRTTAHRPLIDALWEHTLELGRLPHIDEIERKTADALIKRFGSIRTAARLARQIHPAEALSEARRTRNEDLQVYFALNQFEQRKPYRALPEELQRDIRAFFGSHRAALDVGEALLYTAGSPPHVAESCIAAAARGTGHWDGHSLWLHSDLVPRLPPELRVYIGCAERLYGDVGGDLLRIHAHSSKLTLLRYDDFHSKALPRLVERVKIKLREREVDFFEHGDDKASARLVLKSRYMATDQPGFARQQRFDTQLQGLGVFDFDQFGPSAAELARGITRAGYRVVGFDLVSAPGQSSGRR